MKYLVVRKSDISRFGAWFLTMALLIAQTGHAIGDYSRLANCLADSGELVSLSHDHHGEGDHHPFQHGQRHQTKAALVYKVQNKDCECSSMCPFCKGYPSAYLFPIPVSLDIVVADRSETYFQSVPVYTNHLEPPLRPPPITRPV